MSSLEEYALEHIKDRNLSKSLESIYLVMVKSTDKFLRAHEDSDKVIITNEVVTKMVDVRFNGIINVFSDELWLIQKRELTKYPDVVKLTIVGGKGLSHSFYCNSVSEFVLDNYSDLEDLEMIGSKEVFGYITPDSGIEFEYLNVGGEIISLSIHGYESEIDLLEKGGSNERVGKKYSRS